MKFFQTTFCALLLSGFALAAAPAAHAQVNVNVNVGQPAWGPAVPQGAQYYYIPEVDGYYDLQAQRYIVLRNGQWLPVAALSGYDPYQFHPVVLDYRGRQPWTYVGAHRDRYRPVVYRPGPPRGLPPGQAKKLYRQGSYDSRGLPPGQAKKAYRADYNGGHDNGHGQGHGRGHN
ncbi:hypothetical protein [Hymenobacter coccineus]|uniref:Uncharacterized protein n=1 Tax=Hymenobacter coccineus TaxID=1908235 RepID=A0A1G1TFU2_9BACT|nr:hypothetical protein [Hymenobacter coccineus]OGX89738.1 hypothetical protein BEN49_24630 [Hymenobacter coccineus]